MPAKPSVSTPTSRPELSIQDTPPQLTPKAQFWFGFRDNLPLAVGVAIYGLAFGILASQAMLTELEVGFMSALVFGGAAQIIAVERIVAGAGAIAAVAAAVAINLRLLLVTASIRDIFRNRPFWQVALGTHMTTDENWALMLATRAKGVDVGYWYLVGGGVCLLASWGTSTVCGVAFTTLLPAPQAIGMDFAFTAAFIAIAVSLWRGSKDLFPWVTAILVVLTTVWTQWIDTSWCIVLGGIAGSAVAGLSGHD